MIKPAIEASKSVGQAPTTDGTGTNTDGTQSKYENVLVVGATSSLARAFAEELAKRKTRLFLAGRNEEEIRRLASDLTIRYGCQTFTGVFIAEDYGSHQNFFAQARRTLDTIDGVFVAVGELGDQTQSQLDFDRAKRVIDSNYTGIASLLTYVSEYLQAQKGGFIITVSSVAGDRGRQSNYIYGSAKAAMSTYMQGLRNRLSGYGVVVMTVKPGFLDTKMTFGMVSGPLVAGTQSVARQILCALDKREVIVYAPWFWRYIMLIIKLIPEQLFMQLKL